MTKSKIPLKAGKLFVLVILLLVSIPNIVSLSNYAFAQVDTAWVRIYNGPADGVDYAFALAVDRFGNVCVNGLICNGASSCDYATIKYDINGQTAWVRTHAGPISAPEYEDAPIAVDASGNVYVTGETDGDYLTIKYYPNGDTAWVRTYDGPGSEETGEPYERDQPFAIAVTDSGNVYVSGYSWGGLKPASCEDFGTVKYDSDGNQLWVRRYNGPGNGDDEAWGIAVDGSGNVYVTGGSAGDYATIKYVQFLEELKVYDPGTGDMLILSWAPSSLSNLLGYNVYRSETSGGPHTKVNETLVTDTVYLDGGVQLNTNYYYYVGAVAPWGELRYTKEDSGFAQYPVVLVHGLWAHNTVWDSMKSYLDSDGFEHVWVPELDGWGGHQKNATNLDIFIETQKESVRDFIDSTCGFPDVRPNRVNLIGHSMGGIISRLYVHNFNDNVDHLIMLAAPNAGNWSARFRASLPGADSAIKQLTPDFMTKTFDIEWGVTNAPTVHYHEVAGDYPLCYLGPIAMYSPNDPWPNDGVVAVSSVFHTPAEDQIPTTAGHASHQSIRGDSVVYREYIYPWLTESAPPPLAPREESYLAYYSFDGEDSLEQFLPTHLDSIFSGGSKQHVLTVDSCAVARLGISWCSGNLDVVLYDPYGALIDSAYAENNDSVARGVVEEGDSYRMEFYAIANPLPGNWILEVQGVSVPESGEKYWIEGIVETNLRLIGRTDSDFYFPNDSVVVTGELRKDTVAIVGANVSATINKPDDSFEEFTLFDDGLYHDGQADDGVYATIFTNTDSYGSYGVAVTASGSLRNTNFSRESFFGFVVSDITFMRGDANRDGQIDLGDVVYLINYLFRSGPAPVPLWIGDANCDDMVDLGDVVYLINYLFREGPPPCR
ncbi:MAG: alpha/beta fold hydrolase [candidate division Zixibacteria bacterium]|nr:alpha/beta fold hydrolase [candidate division Zixibacteria bacterium]